MSENREIRLVVENGAVDVGDFIGLTEAIELSNFCHHQGKEAFFNKAIVQEVAVVARKCVGGRIPVL